MQKATPTHQKWIITESLFGIDGTRSSLNEIEDIAKRYDALTYIDDTHSVGMMGKKGMGLAAQRKNIDLVFGSFGQQSGRFGAYLGTSTLLRDYLLSSHPTLERSTLLPPIGLGAVKGVIELIPEMGEVRKNILSLSAKLRTALKESNWETVKEKSHIMPLLFSQDVRAHSKCQAISHALLKEKILLATLRPPYVPQGAERLRLMVNATHQEEDIIRLLNALQNGLEERSLAVI